MVLRIDRRPMGRMVNDFNLQKKRADDQRIEMDTAVQFQTEELQRDIREGRITMEMVPAKMMQALYAANQLRSHGPRDPGELRRLAAEEQAYDHAGICIDADPSTLAFKMVDFYEILQQVRRIDYDPSTFKVHLDCTDEQYEFSGDEAGAFLRYLVYMGVFEAIRSREACPQCKDIDVKELLTKPACEICGGLGWIVAEVEEALA